MRIHRWSTDCFVRELNVMPKINPPETQAALLQRTEKMAGMLIQHLAASMNISVPENLRRSKGWVGQLLETYLGATAGNKAAPDFEALNIELKTLPINAKGMPKETTYVCMVPLSQSRRTCWENSVVYQKLQKVLWVPIESTPEIPLAQRRIGQAVLWSPTSEQQKILKQDWEEHMEKITLGQVQSINAYQGTFLQIRPKAANSKALTEAIGANGEKIQTLPRGFYLRTQLTQSILHKAYL